MRRALLLLLLLVLPFTASGAEWWLKDSGGGGAVVPGFVGGVLTDDSVAYVYSMQSFLNLPSYPRFYFSESTAGGSIPTAGADTNPCTFEAPCRTVDKMEQIANRGQVHIILDSSDDWDLLADWTAAGGDESIVMTDPAACNGIGPDLPCVIFSGSSFSPADRATLTCTNASNTTTNDGLFVVNFSGATHGWFAIQNIETNDCPDTLAYKQSLFVTLAAGSKMVALNFRSVTGIRGSDVATTGENALVRGVGADSEAVFLNAEAEIEDSGVGYAADLFNMLDGSLIAIGRSQLRNLDSDGTLTSLAKIGTQTSVVDPEIVVIGHTLSSSVAVANVNGIQAIWGTSAGASIFTADTTFIGFTAANNSAIYSQFVAGTDSAWISPVTTFRSTFSGTMTAALRSVVNGAATQSTVGRCLLAEDFAAGDFYWRMTAGLGRTDLTRMPTLFEGLYDDDVAGDRYTILGSLYATAALANATIYEVAGYPVSFWEGASVENGGAGVDGDPFGTLASQHACNSADCFARCAASMTASYTFHNSGIPAFVLGEEATGISLGGTIRNFGGR